MHKQSLTDSRNQNYQVHLAEMANKESLEFRRKIGVNEHHDRELQQHEHHDKGKKHFAEQVSADILFYFLYFGICASGWQYFHLTRYGVISCLERILKIFPIYHKEVTRYHEFSTQFR